MNWNLSNRAQNLHTSLMARDRHQTPLSPNSSVRYHSRSPVHSLSQFYLKHWSAVLLSIEFLLNLYFLHHGPLHPIDYPTYLIQARQFRFGERDYAKISGPTGPLVYPGGHVLIFTIFEKSFGIKGDADWSGYLPARWIFLILQLIQTFVLSPSR